MHYSTEEGQRALLALEPELARAAVEHAQTLDEAALVMLHRTSSYALVWQRRGAVSNLLNAARKVERLMESWWTGTSVVPALHKDNLDDAYDAINYLAFFIQCARQGNLLGEDSLIKAREKQRDDLIARLRFVADTASRPEEHDELHKIADTLEQSIL